MVVSLLLLPLGGASVIMGLIGYYLITGGNDNLLMIILTYFYIPVMAIEVASLIPVLNNRFV